MRRVSHKLWSGRLPGPTSPVAERFTSSLAVDRRLAPYDIAGSIAHVRALVRARVLPGRQGGRLVAGLRAVGREIATGRFRFRAGDEDIHSAIERRLTERLGPLAGSLHAGRSRNDQVVLDLRLYLRDEIDSLLASLRELRRALVGLARRHADVLAPGYTHLQRAQPILLAHHLLAYQEMFSRDAARLADCRRRVDVLPLGSGALAGAGFRLDRRRIARELGFAAVSENSMDAVADRDFAVEFLAAAAILATHASRLAEELVLWSSAEFGFIELPDAFSTGSSMMPQKKNPDVPELIRGKAGRVYGALVALLATLKGLPLAYNRDLQEDKAPLFDAASTVGEVTRVLAALLPRVKIRRERLETAADGLLLATDLADALVERGLPFRHAHEVVGRLVRRCLETGRGLRELRPEELRRLSPHLTPALLARLTPAASVRRRRLRGGTAPGEVRGRLAALERELG